MDTARSERLRSLFQEVKRLPRAEWDAWATTNCADAEEREALLKLLEDATDVGSAPPQEGSPRRGGVGSNTMAEAAAFREAAADVSRQAAGLRAVSDPILGQTIGGAKVTAFVGEGGMGRVYRGAWGDPPRDVAIKLLSRGFGKPEAVARFQREAAILGKLQHPGIAEMITSGVWDDGSGGMPFMVMEFVDKARELADYAAEKKLDLRGRLELFLRVCQAVGHAHAMGFVHRDLKPPNLLVDPWGRVKVIDFGVARASGGDLGIASVRTDTGQLIGTLQYMSPEQIAADPRAIDVRTDVYALGVILYELLCEAHPYDVRGLPVHEAARIITETRVPSPREVDPSVDATIDAVLMRCLEKDRFKRFDSAGALAQELERYLAGPGAAARSPAPRAGDAAGVRAPAAPAPHAAPDPDAIPLDNKGSAAGEDLRVSVPGVATSFLPKAPPAGARAAPAPAKGGPLGWILVIIVVGAVVVGSLVMTGVVDVKALLARAGGGGGAGGATPQPAPAGTGAESTESAQILSAPPGAQVLVDGADAGRTPARLTFAWTSASKPRQVEVRLGGWTPASAVVVPDPGGRRAEPVRLVFNLKPEGAPPAQLPRLLALRVEGGAVQVSVAGGAATSLQPGRHEVPLSFQRGSDGRMAPVTVTLKAPGRRVEMGGRSGADELRVDLQPEAVTDEPVTVRVAAP